MFGGCLHLFLNTQHSCIKVMLPGFYTGGHEKLGVILIANLYFTGFPFHLELQGLHPHKLERASQKILLRCPERFLNSLRAMTPFSVLSELWPWHCTVEASVTVPSTAKTQREILSSGHSFKSYSCLEPLHSRCFGAFLQIQNHTRLILARLGSHALECTEPALGLLEGVFVELRCINLNDGPHQFFPAHACCLLPHWELDPSHLPFDLGIV